MHEFALAQQIVDGVLEAVAVPLSNHPTAAPPLRITQVIVRVGNLTGAVPDALRFGFLQAAAGTLVDGAELVVEADVAVVCCTRCGLQERATLPLAPCCATCGGPIRVSGGRDLLLERVVLLETDLAPAPEDN